MPKVCIINSSLEYVEMFKRFGWDISDDILKADLVQFTGGSDVSPSLYNSDRHPTTHCNPDRDKKEQLVFQKAYGMALPMAGICRGGQFLNVMCGGSMWQDVNHHAIHGTHLANDCETGEIFEVTSTHHQMMIPSKEGVIRVLTAQESTWRERVHNKKIIKINSEDPEDIEALYYPAYRVFCFQPHPEFPNYPELASRYMGYLNKYFRLKGTK